MTFGSRLAEAVGARGRLCAGIDPHAALLRDWDLPDSVEGLERFAMTAVEALGPVCAVLKPQSAFFERHGARGIAVLERVVRGCREQGALVLLDVKRGDIGSTVQAYADAYLDPASPLAADAVTASPFLGLGSLDPLVATASAHDAGVFVLALTSNPEGRAVQHARTADGRSVAAEILAGLASRNASGGENGSLGAVVGATVELPADVTAATLDIGGPLLVPGLGAQGGTLADVRRVFGPAAGRVLPSSSREILRTGPDPAALRAAARRTAETFAALG
ncbi:MAG TPA: orotidine-5'-phosphate decarboxylase [Nocardioidaceae bacterium]|nr:orotidine-5'-phosphate decarboxylase [Nocardioidaceae bacterium]